MIHAHHIFQFGDLQRKESVVRFRSGYQLQDNEFRLKLNDDQLLRRYNAIMPAHLGDLVDIGVAVHVADRQSPLRRDRQARRIHVDLALRQPLLFKSRNVYDQLVEALDYFTGDRWSFRFTKRKSPGRLSQLQPRLFEADQPDEVALWSGGLDSLAGLFNRQLDRTHHNYTLFGVSSNRMMLGVQKQTQAAMSEYMESNQLKLEQVSFHSIYTTKTRKNFAPRSRGFLFLLLGAVCAILEGKHSLYVYENGVGAINLPYWKSSTGTDHSRSMHPVGLCRMAELISAINDAPFRFENPFLFWTKAQMCKVLLDRERMDLIQMTISCDRRLREQPLQCGRCSSCLLRRQALAVHGAQEQRFAVPMARLNGKRHNPHDGDYLRAMHHQVTVLAARLKSSNPWKSLASEYANDLPPAVWWLSKTTQISRGKIQEQFVELYARYVDEWHSGDVLHVLGQNLVEAEELMRTDNVAVDERTTQRSSRHEPQSN